MVDSKTATAAKPGPLATGAARVPAARGTTAHVYHEIRNAIANHTFESGQHLQEAFLAEWLGVSRTPVREALRHLERDGLVVPNRARGVVVAQVTIDDISHGYLLLEVLEGLAARLAAQQISDDEIAQLRQVIDEMRRATDAGDFDQWAVLDAELHERVRSIAASHKLSELTALVYPVLDRVRNMYLTDGADSGIRAHLMALHVAMGEAIIARNSEEAERLARELFAEGGRANVALLERWISPLRRSF